MPQDKNQYTKLTIFQCINKKNKKMKLIGKSIHNSIRKNSKYLGTNLTNEV